MDKNSKIEERKRYNAPFLRAFFWLAGERNMNQKQFAMAIESESGYISALKKGTKRVGADYMQRLARAFAEHFEGKGHLNMNFLLGKSEYMLVENIPDEEILANVGRAANPDYDVIQANRKKNENYQHNASLQSSHSSDNSSQLNASISAYVQLTNRLTDDLKYKEKEMADRLADKDARIAALECTITDKEEIIRARDARIALLERQLEEIHMQDISRYHFPIGAAEDKPQPKRTSL